MSQNAPILSAIAAMTENRVIGKDNKMPWHLPADLKHFKTLTSGHPIIMGRKTFESIGRPLPNRTNIILTRDSNFAADNCIVVTSPEAAITLGKECDQEEVFIIGGAEIYQQLMPAIQRIYLTIIHHEFAGDAFFPELSQEWHETSRERHRADESNEFDYTFLTVEKI
jgi:dihydrofolate reductase